MEDLAILSQPFLLTADQIAFYQKNKFIKLKQVLNASAISHFNKVISQKVAELNTQAIPLKDRDTYGKAFLQLMNLWVDSESRRWHYALACGPILLAANHR